jgi:protein-S-isoprenylcysteine O-methyltransferase Ste14
MEIYPVFELGIYNAWVLMIYVILYNILPFYLRSRKIIGNELVRKVGHQNIEYSKSQKQIGIALNLAFFIPIIYSFFLPLKLNTYWFYIGLIIYLIGVIIATDAFYHYVKTPINNLVTKGIYKYSRNPMYLGMILIFTGIGIACLSWLFLLLTFIFLIVTHFLILSEEDYCLKVYKKEYKNYMNKTSRWIGF